VPLANASASRWYESRPKEDADRRARLYTARIGARPVFPTNQAVLSLAAFDEPLPERGRDAAETPKLLDDYGTPATVETNGGRYFGFVTGATLPAAAAAERLVLASWLAGSGPAPGRLKPFSGEILCKTAFWQTMTETSRGRRSHSLSTNDGIQPTKPDGQQTSKPS
jgi:hypothetical protein